MNGWWLRATGAEDSVRPRRLIGRFWAALNFTVRPPLGVALCQMISPTGSLLRDTDGVGDHPRRGKAGW